MTAITKVLCPIDFSPHTCSALHHAMGICRQFHAELYVYHAFHSPRDPIYGNTDFINGRDLEMKRKRARSEIESLMKGCPVAWQSILSVGDPVMESIRICRELTVDLVVAASHGISGFKRVFLGTVVERLVRHLDRPMLVVRAFDSRKRTGPERPFRGFTTIVAGCDFQKDSIPSIRQAAAFCEGFQASLHLLHVLESPINEEIVDSTAAPYGEVQQELTEKMQARLGEVLPEAVRKTVSIRSRVLTGHPAEEILDCAAYLKADLIVVGVRNHTRLDKIMIGSSTERVLRKAPCSVLAVPAVITG